MSTDPAARRGRLRGILLDVEPLRRDRDFRYLWIGQVISGVGRQVTVVALPFQLYVLTRSTLAIGLLALVQLVPILVFALGGGAVADAVDRRRLLLVTQLGLALCSGALLVLAATPGAPIAGYYVVAFVAAGVGAMDQPARSSAVPRLVPRERLPAAIALNQLGFQAMAVAGPALGGLLLATVGVAAAFAFDAVTFAAAIVALLLIAPIPPHPGAARPSLATIAEGLRFVRGRRVVLSSFVIDLVAMIFGMPTALFPALALDVFRVGPAGVGLLAAAPAAGALVGAALTGWVGRIRRPGRAVIVAVGAWGLAITAFGLSAWSFPLALLFLALAGAADVFSAVLRSSIVQLETPDEIRGRVVGVHILVVTSGPRLGDAEAAAVAAVVGPQLSVVSGGILCLVGLVAVVRRFPELGRYVSPVAAPPEPVA
ncbi:MAG TPA: MFS transporter [Candidatus Nanopelagicales bacterium]|nr:MFS transporter [Candidatus Nanopelagicales bacterium]